MRLSSRLIRSLGLASAGSSSGGGGVEAVERHASACFARADEPCHVPARPFAHRTPLPGARALACMIPGPFSREQKVAGVRNRAFRGEARGASWRACSMHATSDSSRPWLPLSFDTSTRSIEISSFVSMPFGASATPASQPGKRSISSSKISMDWGTRKRDREGRNAARAAGEGGARGRVTNDRRRRTI